ncbi:hypothetical protein VPNG_06890 [Cytospora leucostoma]|uniref:AB hydrolase-1 domain-containing protein n=1 Tax=Cytospora leucostoma TaxID=1230097 RepID=A0A423WXL8_9PEZI|nr:hypothetical protein VPNG_06890 [Cytospora leucostoma]
MASKPTIVIVPGAWQTTGVYQHFADLLKQAGYAPEIVKLPSTGGTDLPLTGLTEDIAAIQAVIKPLVEAGKEVVVVAHSAGGVSGGGAVNGLDVKTRKAAGQSGGVTKVIYLAAFLIPKGTSLLGLLGGKPLPWMVMQEDRVTVNQELFPEVGFSDLPAADAKKWTEATTHTAAALFASTSEYEPWAAGVPTAYIHTADDGALPYGLQQQLAAQLGDAPQVTLKANHSPFLSIPEETVKAVEKLI